jgi:competence protein ComEC
MASSKMLTITFWDVGQGDCSTVELPDGKLIIIDTGNIGSPLVDWLKNKPRDIQAIVITHNDADHVGALPSVLDAAKSINQVYMLQDRPAAKAPFTKLFRRVVEGELNGRYQVKRLEVGTEIWVDKVQDIRLHVVYPSMSANVLASKPNKTSGIICLTIKGKTELIWPGDASLDSVAANCKDTKPYFMVGPHHGAPEGYEKRAATSGHLSTISPQRAFISVGTTNGYSHPRPKYIRLLEQSGAKVCCSQITVACDRQHVMEVKRPVLSTHGLLGLTPPRSGLSCRGPLQLHLGPSGIIGDGWDDEHQKRIAQLRRPQCLRGRESFKDLA